MKAIIYPLILFFLYSGFAFGQKQKVPESEITTIEDSIKACISRKDFEKGLQFSRTWLESLKKQGKENDPRYGKALYFQGKFLNILDQDEEAEKYLKASLNLRKSLFGENNTDVADSYFGLGGLYEGQKKHDLAIENFLASIRIYSEVKGDTSPKILEAWVAIGNSHYTKGDYPNAEKSYQKGIETFQKSGAKENYWYGELYRMLGIVNKDAGQFSKMETSFLKAFEIYKRILPENHPKVGEAYNNVGAIYSENGNYQKALPYLEKGLDIRIKYYGEDNAIVGQSYINLGALYFNLKQNEKALNCSEKAIRILSSKLGENHLYLGYTYLNTGELLENMGQYLKAEKYFLKSYAILEANQGKNHPDMALISTALSGIYMETGQFEKGKKYGNEALSLYKRYQNPLFYGFAPAYSSLGLIEAFGGNYQAGLNYFQKANDVVLRVVAQNFPSLSDEEKENFYKKMEPCLDQFKAFCGAAYPKLPVAAGELYNVQLVTKGLLLNSSAKWKHRIRSSGDVKLFGLYTRWLDLQKELVSRQQSGDSLLLSGMDSIRTASEKLEKELSLRSENFARLADKKAVVWQDVQKKLKPGEAAVEMVRLYSLGQFNTVRDTSENTDRIIRLFGTTDSVWYAALILKPGMQGPEMVLLKNGKDLEGKFRAYYQNAVKKQIMDKNSYGHFWEKISRRLGPVKRVYFSPDGIYHQINLNTLYNPATKKYLLEETDIRLVTGSKDLLQTGATEIENKLANLVGFPEFYNNQKPTLAAASTRNSPELTYGGLRFDANTRISDLPGTQEEIGRIESLLTEKGWEVQKLVAGNALEESLKESYKPGLLHIATHGFFQADSTSGINPLLRSGLLLAGAGSSLKGQKPEKGEDGILTAYEAMNLNLDNTDLVVLSACETGLGEIKKGEGVYGLQRAFKVAGAKSIIMSLWKVDDEATQELMVAFYKNWLGQAVGTAGQTAPSGQTAQDQKVFQPSVLTATISKRAAFLQAQKELKAKYPNPYYWGAFVMVGE